MLDTCYSGGMGHNVQNSDTLLEDCLQSHLNEDNKIVGCNMGFSVCNKVPILDLSKADDNALMVTIRMRMKTQEGH